MSIVASSDQSSLALAADIFVSPEWLASRLGEPTIVVVDANWHLPSQGKSAVDEVLSERIEGSIYFDLEKVASPEPGPPGRMLPTAEIFAEAVGRLGIHRHDHVVVYDHQGLYSAARIWWMFRVFQHEKVSILDGGLPSWKAAGHETISGPLPETRASDYAARPAQAS